MSEHAYPSIPHDGIIAALRRNAPVNTVLAWSAAAALESADAEIARLRDEIATMLHEPEED